MGLRKECRSSWKTKSSRPLTGRGKKRISDYVLEPENTAVWESILGKYCCELALPQAALFSRWFQWTLDVSCWGGCFLPFFFMREFTLDCLCRLLSCLSGKLAWLLILLYSVNNFLAFIVIGERQAYLVRFLKLERVGKDWDKMEWDFIRLT